MAQKPCKHEGCEYPKIPGKHRCRWHYMLSLEPEARVRDADLRLKREKQEPTFKERARVPEAEWPAGERFCSGCQSFVPRFYTTGSRCKGCASRAAHAAHLKATYDITREEYEAIYAFQGGVCYICLAPGRTRRLAVDHDHRTGVIRGLLCSSDEWGCNMSLRRLLNDVEMARRAVEYVELSPWSRMKSGETAAAPPKKLTTLDLIRTATRPETRPGTPKPADPEDSGWAGF